MTAPNMMWITIPLARMTATVTANRTIVTPTMTATAFRRPKKAPTAMATAIRAMPSTMMAMRWPTISIRMTITTARIPAPRTPTAMAMAATRPQPQPATGMEAATAMAMTKAATEAISAM